jgi:hypothetical protein
VKVSISPFFTGLLASEQSVFSSQLTDAFKKNSKGIYFVQFSALICKDNKFFTLVTGSEVLG